MAGPSGDGLDRVRFGPYRFDPDRGCLWRGDERVALQPRPLAVLRYLAARPGAVVGRDELIQKLWVGTFVTKAVIKVAVRAIREALDDDAASPAYIETVGRDGYRFIGVTADPEIDANRKSPRPAALAIVGREQERAALDLALDRAAAGERRIVFVSGEAGIGKTAVIDRFVADALGAKRACVGRGQCLELYGAGEPYLPVLEALGELVRDDPANPLALALRRHAPTWASQLPPLATDATPASRKRNAAAPAPSRMLREIADALEVATRERALVLVFEDLQWSDPSTVELIACLARRRQPARLMLVCSLRPADLIVHDHALRAVRQELQANRQCEDLPLELLTTADVTAYLSARFDMASAAVLRRLAVLVHAQTEGNALFMVNVVNDLVTRGLLVARDGRWHLDGSIERAIDGVPMGLQELLLRRITGLDPGARRALEAASVAGDEFAVAAVAAALGDDVDRVEDFFEGLAAQGTLIAGAGIAEWPDGSLTGRYRFRHALYRRALYDGIGEARRIRLHRAIGLREEAAFVARVSERAAELAMHFTRGHDRGRALEYHTLAGSAALENHAAHEAVSHFSAALDALAHESDGSAQAERELGLVTTLATLLMATRGYAAVETERTFARAHVLCDALPANPQRDVVLRGLVSYRHVRAELSDAHELGELLLAHAAQHSDARALRVQAHYAHGATLFHMGALDAARTHFEAALRDYEPGTHAEQVRTYGGYDPGVACSFWLAWTLALQGRLAEVAAYDRGGLALAERHGDVFSLAWAHYAAGVTQQVFGDWATSEIASAESVRLAEEHHFPYVRGMALANRGWALIMLGKAATGIPVLRDGIAAVEATGARLLRASYLAMLAAADAIEGDHATAARRLDEGLAEVEQTGERLHEATLLIAKSHLLVAASPQGRPTAASVLAAETCLRRAIDVAHAQGARLLGLRAAVALARHCAKDRRPAEGRALLVAAHAPFEGLASLAPEIGAARRLLAERAS